MSALGQKRTYPLGLARPSAASDDGIKPVLRRQLSSKSENDDTTEPSLVGAVQLR